MADPKQQEQKPLPPHTRMSLESGLITEGAVSENLMPETCLTELVNMDPDTIGSARSRLGTTALGGALPSVVLGLYYFVDTVGSPTGTQTIAVSGTAAYYLSGASWTPIRSALTGGSKARFSTFLNYVFMVNGADATAVWDGNTAGAFSTGGNASGAPIGTQVENFRSRMWIAGNPTYPDRLFYSSIPSSVVTPVVSWNTDPATGQWIDISPSDGENITCLHRTRNNMLVFKQNHIYRVYSISQTDPDPYYAVGTSSAESVVETKIGVFFHHSSGFYQYNVYGIVQEISRPIIDIVKAISLSNYQSVAGWLDPDGDHINWSIGTVTYKGTTYQNMVVRYSISTQVWTQRVYPTQFVASSDYNDGSTKMKIAGDSAGNVYEYNVGTTDRGTPIQYSIVHPWDNIDGLLSTRKTLQTVLFSHYGGAGTNVSYQVENDPAGDWSKCGDRPSQLKDSNTGFNSMNIRARKIRFRLSGASSGQPFVYNGYEVIGVYNEFLQFS